MRNRQASYKLMVVGDAAVGKTATVARYFNEKAESSPAYQKTVGARFEIKSIKLDAAPVTLQCWDVGGGEIFSNLSSSYYRSTDAFLLFYDTTNRQSLINLNSWLAEIKQKSSPNEQCVFVLVGTKADLKAQRQVCDADIVVMQEKIQATFQLKQAPTHHEVSVEEPVKIKQLFARTVRQLLAVMSPAVEQLPREVKRSLRHLLSRESDNTAVVMASIVMVLSLALLAALFWPAIIAMSITQIVVMSVITLGAMGIVMFGVSRFQEGAELPPQTLVADSTLRYLFEGLGVDDDHSLGLSREKDLSLDDNPVPVVASQPQPQPQPQSETEAVLTNRF